MLAAIAGALHMSYPRNTWAAALQQSCMHAHMALVRTFETCTTAESGELALALMT